MVSSEYLGLLTFLLAIWIPASDSSNPAFCLIFSAYKLNKQSDSIQPGWTSFQSWTSQLFHVQFCCFLTCTQLSQETGQVVWYSYLRIFHNLLCSTESKAFTQLMKQVFFFLEFPCFLHNVMNVGNLISGSSAFSKPSLYIWKFLVHIQLKPSLKDFKYNLANMWNECNCTVVWTFFVIALWD